MAFQLGDIVPVDTTDLVAQLSRIVLIEPSDRLILDHANSTPDGRIQSELAQREVY